MALTPFQRDVCRLLAENRKASGESYVAGSVALNMVMGAARRSRDVDIFHDTTEALTASWAADRRVLEDTGHTVRVIRERPTFVEAEISRTDERLLMQWVRDSAYRFFPLVENVELGLTMHPFDLATNKVLALVGRLEVRDWVDVIESAHRIQPLGFLAWAACGKDPGFSPLAILEHAARSSRYSKDEVATLDFEVTPPDASELSRQWHDMLKRAHETVAELPAEQSGKCVLARDGSLFTDEGEKLREALANSQMVFHTGSIRGAFPQLIMTP
jgi:hypothetical protein